MDTPGQDVRVEQGLVGTLHGGGLREGPGLQGYAAGELADGGRGQVLAPWPNRLRDGRWSWRGRDLRLPLSEPAGGTAIHGLVRWALWEQTGPGRLEHTLAPQPGYPFWLRLSASYVSSGPGAWSVTHTATNLSREPTPYGLGQHPYLTVGTPLVDAAELTVRAGRQLEADARGLPTGERPSEGWSGRIGPAVLDATLTDLVRGSDGRAEVVLRGPDRMVRLWAAEAFPWLQVFSGDTLATGRRTGLAVEPMTCPPDALASGRDLVVLEPGETWSGSWGVEVS